MPTKDELTRAAHRLSSGATHAIKDLPSRTRRLADTGRARLATGALLGGDAVHVRLRSARRAVEEAQVAELRAEEARRQAEAAHERARARLEEARDTLLEARELSEQSIAATRAAAEEAQQQTMQVATETANLMTGERDLTTMTKQELTELAAARGVEGRSSMTKSELVAALATAS
jgi:hypothetical protein